MRTDILESKEQILLWIDENRSKAFICQQLRCKTTTLNAWLSKLVINYSGNMGLKGIPHINQRLSAKEYAKSASAKSVILKQKLIEEGIKEDKCEHCNLTEWQGKKIPTELHHKDGNHHNNTDFNNLEILCCNCHQLVDDIIRRKNAKPKPTRKPKPRKSDRKSPRIKLEMMNVIHRTPLEYHNDRNKEYWDNQQQYIPLVINSDIDFTKFGWVTKLAPIIDQPPQRVHKWMKKFLPDFYNEKCFKRFNNG
jgi:hypothetical protein